MKFERAFYERPVLAVARSLVGAVLVHRTPKGVTAGRIVECEAYRGPADLAAHSAGGRRTPRTEVMFGRAGHAYMFFIYGMHWAFNIVTGKVGEPHAVLIRALEPIEGLSLMSKRRGLPASRVELTNGPGKLCEALGLDGSLYGEDLTGDRLYIEAPRDIERSIRLRPMVSRSPRINIDYAGAWAAKPWRFFERSNRFVSRVKPKT